MALQDELRAVRRYHSPKHGLTWVNDSGALFNVTHQTPTTDVTGQTSFDATTPTFLFYGANLNYRGCLRRLKLSQAGTVAGGAITIALAIDTANRFSAGETDITPQNVNADFSRASVWNFLYNPTATAAGTGTRYIDVVTVDADVGTVSTFDFTEQYGEDALVFAAAGSTTGKFTGSFLVYTFAATTGPSWKFSFDYFED